MAQVDPFSNNNSDRWIIDFDPPSPPTPSTTKTGGGRLPPGGDGLHRPVRGAGVHGQDAAEVPRDGAGEGGKGFGCMEWHAQRGTESKVCVHVFRDIYPLTPSSLFLPLHNTNTTTNQTRSCSSPPAPSTRCRRTWAPSSRSVCVPFTKTSLSVIPAFGLRGLGGRRR